MVAISFSGDTMRGPFYNLILSDKKRQTVRKPRKRPIKAGDLLQLYWKQRVPKDKKPIHFIGAARCTHVEKMPYLAFMDDYYFARRDGFNDEEELQDWFDGAKETDEYLVIHFIMIRSCWGCAWAGQLSGIYVCGQAKGRHPSIEPFAGREPKHMSCYELEDHR